MKTLNFKKALAFTALTLTPALALTPTAQAAPAYRAPISQRSNNAPVWNNSRPQAPRFGARSNQAQHFEPRQQDVRVQNNRNDDRFDARRNDARFDSRRDNNNGSSNSTAKIIGAGIVGAILGAVLSH